MENLTEEQEKIRNWNGKHIKNGTCKNGKSLIYDPRCMMCSLIMKMTINNLRQHWKNVLHN